jgi:hypothetical protein
MVTDLQPYVGPRPFERKDQAIFFGRDREASDLLSLVIAHALVLLYAQSGAGKTSLLNARLIPLLEGEKFEILPVARVRDLIPDEIDPNGISNLYIFNTLMSLTKDEPNPQLWAQMSLVDFLKERKHPSDEKGMPLPRVVIFDQFEELFTFYQERWRDREGLFKQVANALEDDPLLRVVFIMREDYIAQLDPYASILPEKLRIRFRLERLREKPALLAVKGPLRNTQRSFAEGVAEKLVEELQKIRVETAAGKWETVTGEFIEPVQLQVVCQSLWQDLPSDVIIITIDHLQEFGDVNEALSWFYESCIDKAVQECGVNEGNLRNWFEHNLITPVGTRGTVHKGQEQTGGIPNTVVDVLEDLHIIRGEWRAGARWYELTHDRLIEPIQKSNQQWLAKLNEIGVSEKDWDLLLGRIKEGACTPILGPGVSHPPLPLGTEIALHWSDKFKYPLYDRENLPRVARFLSVRHDAIFPKDEMRRYLQEILREKGDPNFEDLYQIHRVLAKLPLPIYLTTNYDDFMIKALQLEDKQVITDYCRWNALIEKEPDRIDDKFEPTIEHPFVYHLHGTWNKVDSMVLTEDDYIEFLRNVDRHKLHHRIVRAFAGTSLLFIGYNLEDFSFRTIFKGLIETAGPGLRRHSISVQRNPKSEAKARITDILQLIKELATKLDQQNEIEEIIKKIKKLQSEKKVFSEITQLESKLIKLAVDQDPEMIHIVFNRINLLQNAIERMHRAVPTKEFLKDYFKEINISIYWGSVQDFARELRERCVKEGII